MFVLVRHGDAGRKAVWPGRDADRPLSAAGREQAEGLARNLSTMRRARLVSGPYLRCRQTLEPLSLRPVRATELDDRLVPHAARVTLDIDEAIFHDTIVCTHGETIAALLRHWLRQERVALPIRRSDVRKNVTAKGGAWIFVPEGGTWSGHYMQPVHADPVPS